VALAGRGSAVKPNCIARSGHHRVADNAVAEPRDPFTMENTIHVKVVPPDEEEKLAEAAKTTRLRALRLAKEAADRDAASRVTAASAGRHRRDRTPQGP
jgi:hypothetical protein